jgi:cytoskeletal protein CcmA (bactofilin family)
MGLLNQGFGCGMRRETMNRRVWGIVRLVLTLMVVAAGLLGVAGRANAVEVVEGGVIPAGQTIDDDVFIAYDNVLVEGTVTGDLFAFGSNIRINGTVGGSLFAAGQTIAVNGEVQGSVYAAGSSAILGGASSVGRNVYYAGFGLEQQPGSQVQRDLITAGYQALLSGAVERNVSASVGALVISGEIGGDVRADVGAPDAGGFMFFAPPGAPAAVPLGIRVTEGAEIGGQLTYVSPEAQEDAIGAEPAEGIVYQTPVPDAGQEAQRRDGRSLGLIVVQWIIARLRDLVTLLLLGALILWLWPRWLYRAADVVASQPLLSLGWGVIVWLLGYIGAAILAFLIVLAAILLGIVTLGGLAFAVLGIGFSALGLAFTIFWLSVAYISKLVVAFMVGRWIVRGLSRREEPRTEVATPPGEEPGPEAAPRRVERPRSVAEDGWSLVVGVLIYVLLRAIPILGWLIGLVVTLFGLGALFMALRDGWREHRAVEPV